MNIIYLLKTKSALMII